MTSTAPVVTHRIVVGIDGSPSSGAALEWALRQAQLTGATLEAVTSWEWPSAGGFGMLAPSDFDPEKDGQSVLDDALSSVEGDRDGVKIDSKLVAGPAAMVLVDASVGADLLVVGNRGHSELASLVLGSVSDHCVTHAHSPVVIIREGEGNDDAG